MLSDYDKQDIGDAYYEHGLEEGEAKKAIEVARKLISRNMTDEDIIDISGISQEELANLRTN